MQFPLFLKNNSLHMAIFSQVQTLHGRDSLKDVRLLENTRVKITKRTAGLEFLNNCRDNQLVP